MLCRSSQITIIYTISANQQRNYTPKALAKEEKINEHYNNDFDWYY